MRLLLRQDEPERRPLPARVVRAVFALLGAITIATLIGNALSPLLLVRSPLLLLLLAPDARHVALSVGRLTPSTLVTCVVMRRVLFSIGVFGLGVIYGPSGLKWVEGRSPRFGKVLRFLERVFARFGTPILLVVPFASVCLLAGVARTRFVVFLLATLVGHTLWVSSTYYLGTLISNFSERVVAFFSAHLAASTLVCIALVAAQQLVMRRRKFKIR